MRRATRISIVAAATLAIAATAPLAASADTCLGPPAATGAAVAIPDAGSTASSIVVSGARPYLARVDLITALRHAFPADLDVTLTSPGGTTVMITTDNGGTVDDAFLGTRWSDFADPADPLNPARVASHTFAPGETAAALTPEEPLSNFVGEDPNGVWTLTLVDDNPADLGTLLSWSLDLRTLPAAPTGPITQTTPKGPTIAIPDVDPAGAVSAIEVTGAQPYLSRLIVETSLKHTASGDLDVTLRSPAGTAVTLVHDRGGSNDNVFDGTLWRDDADLFDPVNSARAADRTYSNNVVAATLAPMEPLGAFRGENPNGVWTLTAVDDQAVETGSIASWRLMVSAHGVPSCTTAAAPPGPSGPQPGPGPTAARLGGLKLSPKAFQAAPKGAALSARGKGKGKAKGKGKRLRVAVGATLAFALDRAANVAFAVERKAEGRRAGGKCAKPTRGNRKGAACTRWTAAGSFSRAGAAGINAPRFNGRVGGRKLAPGSYRLIAQPEGGRAAHTGFEILP